MCMYCVHLYKQSGRNFVLAQADRIKEQVKVLSCNLQIVKLWPQLHPRPNLFNAHGVTVQHISLVNLQGVLKPYFDLISPSHSLLYKDRVG